MRKFQFHADVTPAESPEHQRKRVWFNFSNGWSASLVLMAIGANRGNIAALATWRTGIPDSIELGEQEATADEAAAYLAAIAAREPCNMASTLSAALADFLSATNVPTITCDQLARAVASKVGFTPALTSVSRYMGTRCDWEKFTVDGRVAFRRSV